MLSADPMPDQVARLSAQTLPWASGSSAFLRITSWSGGVKLTEARRHAARRPSRSGDLCREGAPLGQSSRASLLVDWPRDEMALLIEVVVDLGVN